MLVRSSLNLDKVLKCRPWKSGWRNDGCKWQVQEPELLWKKREVRILGLKYRGINLFKDLSCFVLTKFKTHSSSGRWVVRWSPGRGMGVTSGVSRARTGDMVLKDVWFRKKIVQSSSCVSAPSGNMDMARTLESGWFSMKPVSEMTYLSSTPNGWGNWYLSWAPSWIWNSARRTNEQWLAIKRGCVRSDPSGNPENSRPHAHTRRASWSAWISTNLYITNFTLGFHQIDLYPVWTFLSAKSSML